MKIVADMRGVTSLWPGSVLVAIATAAIELRAFLSSAGMSSNDITARALLETPDRFKTTSSTEFHQTLPLPLFGL